MHKPIKLDLNEVVFTVRDTEIPTRKFFDELRSARLYVGGWMLSRYYYCPDYEFQGGAIVATAYHNGVPIAVALINVAHDNSLRPSLNSFTRLKYRRNGIAKQLAQLAYERYQQLGHNKPICVEDSTWSGRPANLLHICQDLKIPVIPV